MVGVHEIELRRGGVEIGEHRQGHVVEPDVFAQRRTGISSLVDQSPDDGLRNSLWRQFDMSP
jgi:hypothetical protein